MKTSLQIAKEFLSFGLDSHEANLAKLIREIRKEMRDECAGRVERSVHPRRSLPRDIRDIEIE